MFKYHRNQRGEKGFTLIELLIVIAILGVIAAVVIPNLANLIGSGKDESKNTELTAIQAAVDAMMAKTGSTTITTPAGTATRDMGAFPSTSVASQQLYSTDPATRYMRQPQTEYWYTVDAYGTVIQVAAP